MSGLSSLLSCSERRNPRLDLQHERPALQRRHRVDPVPAARQRIAAAVGLVHEPQRQQPSPHPEDRVVGRNRPDQLGFVVRLPERPREIFVVDLPGALLRVPEPEVGAAAQDALPHLELEAQLELRFGLVERPGQHRRRLRGRARRVVDVIRPHDRQDVVRPVEGEREECRACSGPRVPSAGRSATGRLPACRSRCSVDAVRGSSALAFAGLAVSVRGGAAAGVGAMASAGPRAAAATAASKHARRAVASAIALQRSSSGRLCAWAAGKSAAAANAQCAAAIELAIFIRVSV